MTDWTGRPDRLPWTTNRVVKASTRLSQGAKAVWMEIRSLDSGPEGCYMSASKIGLRLGMSAKNVEKHRTILVGCGLLMSRARRGTAGNWYPVLPPECVPTAERPEDEEVLTLSRRLDRYLSALPGGGGQNNTPPPSSRAVAGQSALPEGGGAEPDPPTPVGDHPPTPVGQVPYSSRDRDWNRLERDWRVPESSSLVVKQPPVSETGCSQASETETGKSQSLVERFEEAKRRLARPGKAAL